MSGQDDLVKQRPDLTAAQRALLEKWKRGAFNGPPREQVIARRTGTGPVPMSFAQQRLWFLAQLEPESPVYNMPAAFTLTGRLNVAALQHSLDELARRHEIMRTHFAMIEGHPVQVVVPVLHLPLPVIALETLPEAEREAEVQRLAREETERPFDLTRGPLLHVYLLRLGAEKHVLLLNLHHIISDGWSLDILFRELGVLYATFSTGRSPALPELPLQYADYSLWQREWLTGAMLEEQLGYWKKQLAELPRLELPTDHPRSATPHYHGSYLRFRLSQELTGDLKRLSRKEGATLFMTLLAAFQVLLSHYSGQEDIVVGTPIANRPREELEGLIGFFTNTLVIRTRLSGYLGFRELLGRVREITLEAYAHQDLPFEKLVEELNPERNLNTNPLFQVMFGLQNTPGSALELVGLDVHPVAIEHNPNLFELSLYLSEGPNGLLGGVAYDRDLFEEKTIERLAEHYQQLLTEIVACPEQQVGDLPLLTQAERQQLLVEWNDTQTAFPLEHCLPALFAAQVARTPEAIAAVCGQEQLTYRELDRRTTLLAHHLRSLGIAPERIVALFLDRSLDMLIALLATFKAGGAYLPLDPAYPPARLALMLQDTEASVIFTRPELLSRLPDDLHARCICLSADWFAQQDEHTPAPLPAIDSPQHLAYVIYTSGSTGRPKGAMVTQQGMVNHLYAKIETLGLHRGDVVAQTASHCFDISVWQFLAALLVGGQVHIVVDEEAHDPQRLLSLVASTSITILETVPSLLRVLLQELDAHRDEGATPWALRWLLVTGEAFPSDLWRRWSEVAPHIPVVNAYGPTECSDDVTHALLTPPCALEGVTAPIGRPIANTQIYLLDERFHPVPVGVAGQLYVGGTGVGRGYWQDPWRTASVFLPDPFSRVPGARLYATGDLARYLPDGTIEFLGRIDEQVKLRGFRIELGEIEAALSRHPAVREAVVLLREDVPGVRRLVAYVVAWPGEAPTLSLIRQALQENLPGYMLPSALVVLERWPLLPNGKLDRRALPTPEDNADDQDGSFVPPRTQMEKVLAGVWAEVLHVSRVGIHDNFFDLGGDSILSLQVIARARQAGIRLTPKQIFQHQTIAQLVGVAEYAPIESAEQGQTRGSVPLAPIQHWFFERVQSDVHHFNQAVLLEVSSDTNPAYLKQALQHILLHHDALRLRFVRESSGWRQYYTEPGDDVPWQQIDLSSLSPQAQAETMASIAETTQASLDVTRGPLMRAVFFTLASHQSHCLLLVIHHLVVDTVSWGILLEDLQVAYEELSQLQPTELPLKTSSFKTWAEHLQAYANSTELQQELPYWMALSQKQIAPLPLDCSGGDNTIASTRACRVSLTVEETTALLQEVPQVYHTHIHEVLLTALTQAWAQWTGAGRLLVDIEEHGREDLFEGVDLSRTVGWFTAIFPLLLDLGEASAAGAALKTIKAQVRAVPHGGVGYGALRYLHENTANIEKLRALPQAEVSFNYLGKVDQALTKSSRFRFASGLTGSTSSLHARRPHLLEITGQVQGEQLHLVWFYSENYHRRTTIEHVAQHTLQALRGLIAHCQNPEAGGYIPSDFPLAGIGQEELDTLIARLEEVQEDN